MLTALCLGGAKCVWDDIEAALDIGEYQGVVACNDIGVEWLGTLDAWVSLHGDKLPDWLKARRARGLPDPKILATHDERKDRPFSLGPKIPYRFKGQTRSGSSGQFAVKAALENFGFDQAVCCGIPMQPSEAHFFDPKLWKGALHHQKGWEQALHLMKDRVRSMSGWTRQLLGPPTPEWLAGTELLAIG